MQTARRVSQILFLLCFLGLFLLAAYPLESGFPVDLFLHSSPLIGLTAVASGRAWFSGALIGLIVLVLTVLLGRFFCGWVCPLGTSVDGSDNVLKARCKNRSASAGLNKPWFKYFLLAAILASAVFSVQLAGYLDPISIFTRSVTTVLYPLFVFTAEGISGFFLSLPLLENTALKWDAFLHRFLLPVSSAQFRGSLLFGLFFFSLLLLAFAQRRYWCRNICPLGALLGFSSKWRWYRRSVTDACTKCGRCEKICRTGAIRPDFISTAHTECINCMDCRAVCPTGAVRFGFVKKPKTARIDLSRRRLLGAGFTGLLTMGLVKTGFQDPVRRGRVIRPPGSLQENGFLDRCVRCGECVRICSTSGRGLQHAGMEAGWEGLASPVLLPPTGYCEYNCNLCGQVCPTGAIRNLDLPEKQAIKMGTAHFDKTHCIPWYYGENCMVCEEHCPVPEKAIKFREEKVKTIDGTDNTVLLPYVVEDTCVGCGICAVRCPVEGTKGIFVTNAGEQRST
jgi:polyferredoxin